MYFLAKLAPAVYVGGAILFTIYVLLLLLSSKEETTSDHTKLIKHTRLCTTAACFMLLGIGIKMFFL